MKIVCTFLAAVTQAFHFVVDNHSLMHSVWSNEHPCAFQLLSAQGTRILWCFHTHPGKLDGEEPLHEVRVTGAKFQLLSAQGTGTLWCFHTHPGEA